MLLPSYTLHIDPSFRGGSQVKQEVSFPTNKQRTAQNFDHFQLSTACAASLAPNDESGCECRNSFASFQLTAVQEKYQPCK
jgi:hypothetical protein